MNGFNITPPNMPIIKNVTRELAEANYASEFARIILNQIQEFDSALGNDFEVGLKLVSFGQTVVLAVHSIGYQNPSLIIFYGTAEDGSPLQLIQHVSQISFLATSLPRNNKETPKRIIGFQQDT